MRQKSICAEYVQPHSVYGTPETHHGRFSALLRRRGAGNTRVPLRWHVFGQIRLIAGREFSDRLRSGWVIACVLVWLGAIGLTSVFGLLQIGRIGMQGYERTVLSLLNLVQYLIPLLGLLLGFELVVAEREEQTLRLTLASGVSRAGLLLGKFFGGCITLAVPLALGFIVAGTAVGLAAPGHGLGQFLKLACSGLGLGVLFLAVGLTLSTFSRTRLQALVLALLAWCLAVFVFDLVALACIVSTKSATAAQQLEFMCDATHVNAAADLHSAYDNLADDTTRTAAANVQSLGWLALNPVDLFRAVNLPAEADVRIPAFSLILSSSLWLMFCLGASAWRFKKIDL